MRHLTSRRLIAAAAGILVLQLFAVAIFRGSIPMPFHQLIGAIIVALVAVAGTVTLVDHRNAVHRQQLTEDVTDMIRGQLADYHRDVCKVIDVANGTVIKAMTTHLASIRDDVVDLTSTARFERIIGDKVRPLVKAETLQAIEDWQHTEAERRRNGNVHNLPGRPRDDN